MWKNKKIAGKVLARLSEWTGVKEEEKRRRGPYPLLQLCLGALLIFAAVVPENHLYRESSGQQTAQDPVREWGDAGIRSGAIEGEDRSAELKRPRCCPA